jgi:hypothetical protein
MPVSVIQRNSGLVGAALALALLAVACDGADVANPPSLTAGPGSNTLFTPDDVGEEGAEVDLPQVFCSKLLGCYPENLMPGSTAAESFMAECLEGASMIMLYVIDPQAFVTCFNAVPCEKLAKTKDMLAAVIQCAAIDAQSVACVSQTKLQFCNTSGTCKQVDCQEICTAMGVPGGGCVEAECECIFDQPQYGSD